MRELNPTEVEVVAGGGPISSDCELECETECELNEDFESECEAECELICEDDG